MRDYHSLGIFSSTAMECPCPPQSIATFFKAGIPALHSKRVNVAFMSLWLYNVYMEGFMREMREVEANLRLVTILLDDIKV